MKNKTYRLLDSGQGRKLEQFGPYRLSRPSAQAVWEPQLSEAEWKRVDAFFTREGDTKWDKSSKIPSTWTIEVAGILFKIAPTDFGHLGIFPEQRDFWEWIPKIIKASGRSGAKVLNLFAYTGGSTFAAAKAGAHVCHLDASKTTVAWARENAALNGLEGAPIRWITDDASKFLAREIRRGTRYDAIILDPPSFGRGTSGEIFKIEEHLQPILKQCRQLLSEHPLFVLFSCHTPGFSPIVMHHLLTQMMGDIPGTIEEGEMVLRGDNGIYPLPSGTYARWTHAS